MLRTVCVRKRKFLLSMHFRFHLEIKRKDKSVFKNCMHAALSIYIEGERLREATKKIPFLVARPLKGKDVRP